MQDRVHSPTFPDSQSLYAACRSSTHTEQSAAYQALGNYLFAFARELLFDQHDAQEMAADSAQEALIRIHRHLDDCNPMAFLGWARTIVRNLVFDELRRRKKLLLTAFVEEQEEETGEWARPVRPQPALVAPALEQTVVTELDRAQLLHLLATAPLSDHARTVLIAFYFDHKSHEEIALEECNRLGRAITPANTMVTLSKAISKLRNYPPLRQFLEPQPT